MSSFHNLRIALPAIILVTTVAAGLGTGYYLAYADSSPAKVAWNVNPLFITFSAQSGSGHASDSFTCNSTISPVTLQARSNQPDVVTLTVSPSAFPSCGSSPNNVVVTASCTAAAQASQSCLGSFSGRVTVCGPTSYTCLPSRSLTVVIKVTGS